MPPGGAAACQCTYSIRDLLFNCNGLIDLLLTVTNSQEISCIICFSNQNGLDMCGLGSFVLCSNMENTFKKQQYGQWCGECVHTHKNCYSDMRLEWS